MTPNNIAEQMKQLREKIDELDEKVVKLLNDRAEFALQLGQVKTQAGMDTYQPEREIAVLEHARHVNGGPLEGSAITRLFERVIDENRRLERQAKNTDKHTEAVSSGRRVEG